MSKHTGPALELELIALGTGDAFSARHYSTCMALQHVASGEWLLLDCPHPIHKILAEAAQASGRVLALEKLAGVVVTHLHADHCSGLEGLGYFVRYRMNDPHAPVPPEALPLLIAGPEVAAILAAEEAARGAGRQIFRSSSLAPGETLQVGRFYLEARRTLHGETPCYAFRIGVSASEKPRVGFSADTRLDPDLLTWLATAQMVVHECGSPIPGTSNHTQAGELLSHLQARADGAEISRKLYLAHYGDEFDPSQSGLAVLEQGRVYPIR